MWKAWTIFFLGLWLIIVSFLEFSPMAVFTNDFVTGLIISVVGFIIVKDKTWPGWIAIVTGIWLLFTAFTYTFHIHGINCSNCLISGLFVLFAGIGVLSSNALPKKNAHSH